MTVPLASNLLPITTSSVEISTAGWTAGANTGLSQSSRFYQGAKSLGLTATAAGTVSATTAARYPVTPGTEYQAYAFFANVVAASGRTSSVTITWWAGSTGGSALSTSVGAATALANSTAWNTPPPQVTAVAPAGAAYASMTITVTGLSAGAVVAADLMTMGVPNVTPSSLLGYNTSSVETDTSGWSAITNATVDRISTDSWEGWYALRTTATASGGTRANTSALYTVTPGTEYVAHAMVRPGVTTLDVQIQIRWYDSGGVFISGSDGPWPAMPGSGWNRVTVIGTPPAGAVSARVSLQTTATAAGQTCLWDMVSLLPAPKIVGTLLDYGTQSVEVGTSGWSAVSGCTIARTSTTQVQGASSMAITTTGAAYATVRTTSAVPVTPRRAYQATAYLYHGVTTANVSIDVLFTWYDSGGVEITTGTYRWETSTAAGWYTPMGADVAPDSAATLRVSFRILSPGASTFYLDEAAVTLGGLGIIADVIPGAYGAAISLQGLTTGGHTHYGVWRVREDGALTAVRGEAGDMTAVPITGDIAVASDYEAPLGVPVTYSVRAYTGSTYLRATSRPVTIPEPPVTDVVVKDPVQPVRSSTLTVDTVPDWTRAARQGVHQITGRATPIVITDVRTSRTGALTVVTATRDDITRLWWLLSSGNTLLIQWPSTWGEQDVYVQVGDVTETHILRWAKYQDRTWALPLTEVDRPIGGLVGSATRTWADVATETDWLDVLTTHSTWLGVYSGEVG